jgi:hypothetical protein
MERLWEHIEHLAPGLVLAILMFFGLSSAMSKAFPISASVARDSVLIGGAFVAFGYLLGVINSSLSRLFFADLLPILDWLQWRHRGDRVASRAHCGVPQYRRLRKSECDRAESMDNVSDRRGTATRCQRPPRTKPPRPQYVPSPAESRNSRHFSLLCFL